MPIWIAYRLAAKIRWWDVNWGDVPTWLSAIATFAALLGAAVAAWIGYRLYQVESERDERAAEDRREARRAAESAQAAKVSAWIQRVDEAVLNSGPGFPVPYFRHGFNINVRNVSELPVYDIYVTVFASDFPRVEMQEVRRIPISVVVPNGLETVFVSDEELESDLPDEVDPVQVWYTVALLFRDSAGKFWSRDVAGVLRQG